MRTGRPKDPRSIEERFWEMVDKGGDNECWNWTGTLFKNGYGRFYYDTNNRTTKSHRVSWLLSYGEIPGGMFICHHCDNKRCVNPKHLFLGTPNDNVQDMIEKGRDGFVGVKNGQSKLDKTDVRIIRYLYKGGAFTQKELGRMYSVYPTNISKIVNRYTWSHLPDL